MSKVGFLTKVKATIKVHCWVLLAYFLLYYVVPTVFKLGGFAPSQTYWQNLNLAVVPHSILHHHEHCARVYQGALLSSRFKYLNKAVSLQVYKKYSWQYAGVELALCTAHIDGHQAGPRMLLHALHVITRCGQNNVAGF